MRDYQVDAPQGVYVIGGFAGELILTFSALYDYILANPGTNNFRFTDIGVQDFLKEILQEGFSEGALTLRLNEDITKRGSEGQDLGEHSPLVGRWLQETDIHDSYGMRFLLANRRENSISEDAISEVFEAIARIVFT